LHIPKKFSRLSDTLLSFLKAKRIQMLFRISEESKTLTGVLHDFTITYLVITTFNWHFLKNELITDVKKKRRGVTLVF